ncbi:hypothetical protein AC1031_001180 [Aphanomyces cochlioides]|nr:hypothetical protein AC1031_001180 [Aphanomyces cochlioides]
MTSRSQVPEASSGSLADFVASKRPKPTISSREKDSRAEEKEPGSPSREEATTSKTQNVTEGSDAGHSSKHRSTDREEKHSSSSRDAHVTKKRTDTHRNDVEDDKHKPSKRYHADSHHTKSSGHSSKSTTMSDAKHESGKLVGVFVQTIEKVLAQYDGEKDRDSAFKKLQKDYLALLNVRQTEPEKLLEESNRLAKEAKIAHDDLNSKLRQQVANLTKKLDKFEKIRENLDRVKARSDLDDSNPETVVALMHENATLLADNDSLRSRLKKMEKELESERSLKHIPVNPATPADTKRYEATIKDLTDKLTQSNKLVGIYELLASLHVGIKSESDEKIEVSCRAMDSLDSKQFCFDLAIPNNPRVQLDYIPAKEEVDHHRRQAEPTIPEYLLDELTFQRSELTRFMRTVLEVVIRKKS